MVGGPHFKICVSGLRKVDNAFHLARNLIPSSHGLLGTCWRNSGRLHHHVVLRRGARGRRGGLGFRRRTRGRCSRIGLLLDSNLSDVDPFALGCGSGGRGLNLVGVEILGRGRLNLLVALEIGGGMVVRGLELWLRDGLGLGAGIRLE